MGETLVFLCKKIKIEVSEQNVSKVYQCVSEKKRHKQKDRLHKASHLIAHTLADCNRGGSQWRIQTASGPQ